MKKFKKIVCLIMAFVMLSCLLCANAVNVSAAYSHPVELSAKAVYEYTNKGNDPKASNGSKYTSAYGVPSNTAWCAIFAWWCADQVGVKTNVVPKTASASGMQSQVYSNGGDYHTNIGSYKPVVGDFVRLSGHLMIVTAVNGDNVTVTHGNWGNTLSQNTYNWKTARSFGGQTIISYITPWYVGDVDKNSSVDTTDARTILQMDAGTVSKPQKGSQKFVRADVNEDGKVNSSDSRVVLQMSAGTA